MIRWSMAPILALVLSSGVTTAEQNIVYGKSRVVCASRQMGVPVEAEFKQFTAHIDFDPAQPATGKIQIEIGTGSFEFDPEIDDEVRGRLWLDANDFPQARFVSSEVRKNGAGYEASGTLSIKGVSGQVVVPFTYRPADGGGVFEGAFTISRLHYNIGEGKWKDTDTVADDVQIKFRLVSNGMSAQKKK